MASSPARTILTSPGGSSSTGHTVSSATGLAQLEVRVGGAPLLRERSAFRLVQGETENAQAEQRALEPHRAERDADFVEQLLAVHLRDLPRCPALDHVHEHRGRGLADRTAPALKANVLDP